jgi:hypothetical protein
LHHKCTRKLHISSLMLGIQSKDPPDSLRATLAAVHQLALHSALHTLPASTLAKCETTDRLFIQSWPAHTAACRHLVAALSTYLEHVPPSFGMTYMDTTVHAAWCRVLGGLEAAVSSPVLDQTTIVHALKHMPHSDSSVAAWACMQAARSAGELVKVRSMVEEAQEAAGVDAAALRAPEAAAAQLVGAASGERDSLRLGIIDGIAAVADSLEAAAESLRQYDSARLEATGPTCDAWGMLLQMQATEVELLPAAVVLFRDGGLANLVRDVCGALQTVAAHKGVSAVLGGPQAQSLLVAVQTNIDILVGAAANFDRLAGAVERATGAQNLVAHAFAAAIALPGEAEEGAPVALLARAFAQPVHTLRGAISQLAAQQLRADALHASIDGHGAADIVMRGRIAESDRAVEVACKAVHEAAEHVNDALASEAGLASVITAAADQRYLEMATGKGDALLDVDNAVRAAAACHGQLSATMALVPLVHVALGELAAALAECVGAAAGISLNVPARWHVGEGAMNVADCKPLPAAAATLWGGTSIWGVGGVSGGIWGAADAASRPSKQEGWRWPPDLNGYWGTCAAVFVVDAILQEAATPPTAAAPDRPSRLAAHPHAAVVDTAERCTAEALACGPTVTVLAFLRDLTKNLTAPPITVARLPPTVPTALQDAAARPSAGLMTTPLWPPAPPRQVAEPPHAHMQSLGRVAVQDPQPPHPPQQEGERELQAFTFFDENVCGADIMLGGLSETSSLEAQSVRDPSEALAADLSAEPEEVGLHAHRQLHADGSQSHHQRAVLEFDSSSAFPWSNLEDVSEGVRPFACSLFFPVSRDQPAKQW